MKKFAFFLITMMFSLVANAQPLLYVEGKHYEVISKQISAEPNVTEFFSFYCPHCYQFEFVAKNLTKALPEGVSFDKSHVDFLRSAPQAIQHGLTRAMLAAEKMGAKDKVVDAIFTNIHQQRMQFNSEEDILRIFTQVGLDAAKAKQLMDSKIVLDAANGMKATQEKLSQTGALRGVPMLVVNDKYKVLPGELRSMQDYQSLVAYLLTLK